MKCLRSLWVICPLKPWFYLWLQLSRNGARLPGDGERDTERTNELIFHWLGATAAVERLTFKGWEEAEALVLLLICLLLQIKAG